MKFKFFPNTQSAEKFAKLKKCTQYDIDEFKNQFNVVLELQEGLSELRSVYKKNFERDKADSIENAKYVLSQVNGIIKELIEKYQDLKEGKIDRTMKGSRYYIEEVK
jgi:geranylgeranyl pyrophosphate synthase